MLDSKELDLSKTQAITHRNQISTSRPLSKRNSVNLR